MAQAQPGKPAPRNPSVWDCLRLPLQFYVEWLFGYLALIALTTFLQRFMGPGAYMALVLFGGMLSFAVILRLVRRVITQRNQRGPMPPKGLAAFWVALLVPVLSFGAFIYMIRNRDLDELKRQEAKAALTEVYEAEQRFRKDFGSFTLSMKELGYNPDEEKPRLYMVGFPSACSVKAGLSPPRSQVPMQLAPFSEMRKLEIEEFFLRVRNPEDCKEPKEAFEAYAVGLLKENGPLDVWRIDEKKKLEKLPAR